MRDGPNFENPIKRAPTNERMFATNRALILKNLKSKDYKFSDRKLDKKDLLSEHAEILPKSDYFNFVDRASWGILNHDCYFDLSMC